MNENTRLEISLTAQVPGEVSPSFCAEDQRQAELLGAEPLVRHEGGWAVGGYLAKRLIRKQAKSGAGVVR